LGKLKWCKAMSDIAKFLEDHEDEIVVIALKKYYDLCSQPNKIDNSDMIIEPDQEILDALAIVLRDFMAPSEYLKWVEEAKYVSETD